jgi:hypothetical protein
MKFMNKQNGSNVVVYYSVYKHNITITFDITQQDGSYQTKWFSSLVLFTSLFLVIRNTCDFEILDDLVLKVT